jgi:hypothetical protein
MYKEILKFLTSHMHVCIAKGFPLTLITQIFSTNFLLEREILELMPL